MYDYAAGGALVVHHLDPYLVGPHSLGAAQRVVSTVSPAWSQTASPYGPLFLLVAAAVARVAGQHDIVAVTLLRVVALGALVATIVVLSRLAATLGRPPAPAVWLVAANPLVITAYVGGAHNDVFMMALLSGGLLLHAHGRALSALLLIVAAAEVKVVALAGLAVLLADMWLRGDGSTRPRVLRDAALSCAMFVVATSLLGLPLGHGLLGGWGWLSALSVPGRVITAVTPLDSLWDLVRGVTPYHLVRGRHVLQPGPDQLLLKYLRVAALEATASVVVVAAASVRRIGPIRASGLALFSVVLLGVVVWPWYLVVVWPWYLLWPVVLLAVAGRRRAERLAVARSLPSVCCCCSSTALAGRRYGEAPGTGLEPGQPRWSRSWWLPAWRCSSSGGPMAQPSHGG